MNKMTRWAIEHERWFFPALSFTFQVLSILIILWLFTFIGSFIEPSEEEELGILYRQYQVERASMDRSTPLGRNKKRPLPREIPK